MWNSRDLEPGSPEALMSIRADLMEKIWALPRGVLKGAAVLVLIRLSMYADEDYIRQETLQSLSLATKLCQDSVVDNINILEKKQFIQRIKQGSRRSIATAYKINIERINQIID